MGQQGQCQHGHAQGEKDGQEAAGMQAVGIALHQQRGHHARHTERVQRPVAGNEGQQDDAAAVAFGDEAGVVQHGQHYHGHPHQQVLFQTLAREDVGQGAYGVRPADESQYAPPANLEGHSVQVFIDHQKGQQGHACGLHTDEKALVCTFSFRIDAPGEEETGHHEQAEGRVGQATFHAGAVHGEEPHGHQRHRAPEDVGYDL